MVSTVGDFTGSSKQLSEGTFDSFPASENILRPISVASLRPPKGGLSCLQLPTSLVLVLRFLWNKKINLGVPWQSSGQGLRAFTAGAQPPSLVQELRVCKPCGEAKKKKKLVALSGWGNCKHIQIVLAFAVYFYTLFDPQWCYELRASLSSFLKTFMHLAMSDLGCGKSLIFVEACGMFQLWHVNSIVACGIQIPDQGSNLGSPASGAWSLRHWTTREVPELYR